MRTRGGNRYGLRDIRKQYEGVPIVTDTWINIDVGCGWGYPPLLLRLDDMKEFYPAETKRDQTE